MKAKPKILIIEDSNKESDLEIKVIKKAIPVCEFKIVDNEIDFLKQLNSYLPDVIISDLKLRKFKGLEALKIAIDIAPEIPFIFVARIKETETAVKCIKAGAYDFITKENMSKLGKAVLYSLQTMKERDSNPKEETLDETENSEQVIGSEENSITKDLLENILKNSKVLAERIHDEELNYSAECITNDCKKLIDLLK